MTLPSHDLDRKRFWAIGGGMKRSAKVANAIQRAIVQLERFSIRAADALHLSAALIWCNQKPRGRLFVCNDMRLGDAARQAGFTVEGV